MISKLNRYIPAMRKAKQEVAEGDDPTRPSWNCRLLLLAIGADPSSNLAHATLAKCFTPACMIAGLSWCNWDDRIYRGIGTYSRTVSERGL